MVRLRPALDAPGCAASYVAVVKATGMRSIPTRQGAFGWRERTEPWEPLLARFDIDLDAADGTEVKDWVTRHPRLLPALSRLRDEAGRAFGAGCSVGLALVTGPGARRPVGVLVMVRLAGHGVHALGNYQQLSAWWHRHASKTERERIALGIAYDPAPANDNAG